MIFERLVRKLENMLAQQERENREFRLPRGQLVRVNSINIL